MDLQGTYEETKYLEKHVNEVGTKNEEMRGQRKKKEADVIESRSRASELRSATRKVLASERAVCHEMILSFRKREECFTTYVGVDRLEQDVHEEGLNRHGGAQQRQ